MVMNWLKQFIEWLTSLDATVTYTDGSKEKFRWHEEQGKWIPLKGCKK